MEERCVTRILISSLSHRQQWNRYWFRKKRGRRQGNTKLRSIDRLNRRIYASRKFRNFPVSLRTVSPSKWQRQSPLNYFFIFPPISLGLIANITWDCYQTPQIFIRGFYSFKCLSLDTHLVAKDERCGLSLEFFFSSDSLAHSLMLRCSIHAGIGKVLKEEIISFPSGLMYALRYLFVRQSRLYESDYEVESPQTISSERQRLVWSVQMLLSSSSLWNPRWNF